MIGDFETRLVVEIDGHRVSLVSRPVSAESVGFAYQTFASIDGGAEFTVDRWGVSRGCARIALEQWRAA